MHVWSTLHLLSMESDILLVNGDWSLSRDEFAIALPNEIRKQRSGSIAWESIIRYECCMLFFAVRVGSIHDRTTLKHELSKGWYKIERCSKLHDL